MYDFGQAQPVLIQKVADLLRVLDPARHTVESDGTIVDFCLDSRKVQPGSVFIALGGSRADGHQFVKQALESGAVACVISSFERVGDAKQCIQVPDAANALGFLAACHRLALPTKIIGLTGSVGKTTTKEILATLMSVSWKTQKSEGNFNNTLGLPLQLLRLTEEDQWMIAEMGMSTPGEIAKLMKMAKPDMGLFLSVEAVHLANFENLEEIAKAKAEMVDHLGRDKPLIYNMDNDLVCKYSRRHPGPRYAYSLVNPGADFSARIESFPNWSGTHFELTYGDGQTQVFFLPLPGKYNVYNALAACAASLVADLPVTELKFAFKLVKPLSGRSHLKIFARDVQFVDDTYNSNPHALEHVLRCFAPLSAKNYRWIVIGDMLELGPDEKTIHAELGKKLNTYGFDRITLVGPLAKYAFEQLDAAEGRIEYFLNVDEAVNVMDFDVPDHARIWCKASRGIGLERVAGAIQDNLAAEGP